MKRVPVNNIIPISTVDGPGARTSIFVQKCNLHCAYCHNPETIKTCIHCGACVQGCPSGALDIVEGVVTWDRKKCTQCDQCIQVCPHSASPRIEWQSAEETLDQIGDDLLFVRGITTSGGECTLYPDYLTDLFAGVKAKGKTTLMDANGTTDFMDHPDLLAVTDGVMVDMKAWDDDVFEKLTGVRRRIPIQKILKDLYRLGKLYEIRIVCLEDWVDTEAILQGIAREVPEIMESVTLKLIAFRNNGVKGPLKDHPSPSKAVMDGYHKMAQDLGFKKIERR